MGEKYGHDFTHLSESLTLDSIEYFLFPNAFFFPGLSLPMVYRFRPDPESPDYCYFDLIFMRPRPSDGKAPDPPEVTTLDINESYSTVEGVGPLEKFTTKIPQILQHKLEDSKQAISADKPRKLSGNTSTSFTKASPRLS